MKKKIDKMFFSYPSKYFLFAVFAVGILLTLIIPIFLKYVVQGREQIKSIYQKAEYKLEENFDYDQLLDGDEQKMEIIIEDQLESNYEKCGGDINIECPEGFSCSTESVAPGEIGNCIPIQEDGSNMITM